MFIRFHNEIVYIGTRAPFCNQRLLCTLVLKPSVVALDVKQINVIYSLHLKANTVFILLRYQRYQTELSLYIYFKPPHQHVHYLCTLLITVQILWQFIFCNLPLRAFYVNFSPCLLIVLSAVLKVKWYW
jgi:hypothetical protein